MNLSPIRDLILPFKSFFHLVALAGSLLVSLPTAADVVQVELTKALDQSDAIKAARLDVRRALERIGVAGSSMDLTSNLSVTGSAVQSSTDDQDFTKADNAKVTLSVKQPLYDGGLANAETSAAMLNVTRARIGLAQAEQNVLRDALLAYINLVVARDRLALEEANVSRLEEYLKATQIRLEVGEATPTDLAATKARLARAQASHIAAEAELVTARESYESLMGTPPPQMALPELPMIMPATVAQAGDLAITHGLSHRLVMLDQEQALSDLDILTARVRPKLEIEVKGSSMETAVDLRDSDEVSASLTFSMPLFPNNAVRASSRAAVASHRSAIFAERDSLRVTRLNAENAQRRLMAQDSVIKAHEAELSSARLFRDGTRSEADFGLKTVLDVLDAEQDVVSAEVSLLLARRDRINAGVDVLAFIGMLNTEAFGIAGSALADDTSEIVSPIRLRPLPTLVYPE